MAIPEGIAEVSVAIHKELEAVLQEVRINLRNFLFESKTVMEAADKFDRYQKKEGITLALHDRPTLTHCSGLWGNRTSCQIRKLIKMAVSNFGP